MIRIHLRLTWRSIFFCGSNLKVLMRSKETGIKVENEEDYGHLFLRQGPRLSRLACLGITHVLCPRRPEEGFRSSLNCWKSNPSSLGEEPAVSATEPSLHPPTLGFWPSYLQVWTTMSVLCDAGHYSHLCVLSQHSTQWTTWPGPDCGFLDRVKGTHSFKISAEIL